MIPGCSPLGSGFVAVLSGTGHGRETCCNQATNKIGSIGSSSVHKISMASILGAPVTGMNSIVTWPLAATSKA